MANDAEGVLILAHGSASDAFAEAIRDSPPPLARIEAIEVQPHIFAQAPQGFRIAASGAAGAQTTVAQDAATCADCLAEIAAPGRRQGYAFTNCTNCGPRYSILLDLPYDRAATTMAGFRMCPACRAEYDDPTDRRFHAQPIACPACGPRLWLEEAGGEVAGEAIALAAQHLAQGAVVAIKGLGGFHLAVDATDADAIARLRARKHRPAKPFALMATQAHIRAHADVSPAEAARLADASAPIVLLASRGTLPESLAPGLNTLGFMQPHTPLHHLLLAAVGGPLVMTSANRSGDPQATDERRRARGSGRDCRRVPDA